VARIEREVAKAHEVLGQVAAKVPTEAEGPSDLALWHVLDSDGDALLSVLSQRSGAPALEGPARRRRLRYYHRNLRAPGQLCDPDQGLIGPEIPGVATQGRVESEDRYAVLLGEVAEVARLVGAQRSSIMISTPSKPTSAAQE